MPVLWTAIANKAQQIRASRVSVRSTEGDEGQQTTDLEAQTPGEEAAKGGRKSAFAAATRVSRASLASAKINMEEKFADSRLATGVFHAQQLFQGATRRMTVRRRMVFRNNANSNRAKLLAKIRDPEERSRVVRLRGKMKLAQLKGAKKDDGDEEVKHEHGRHSMSMATDEDKEDRKHEDDMPEEGELVDLIQELSLTVEPAVEMLGDLSLLDQRRKGTLDVRSEQTVNSFKKHKAVMGKQLFEAENANNMACEQFYLGDVESATIYFQRALTICSAERRPAADEVEDLRRYIAFHYNGNVELFYAALSEGEYRSALGRRVFCEACKKVKYPGNPERLFEICDSISRDGKIAVAEVETVLKAKSQRLEVIDYDLMEKGVILNNLAACLLQKGDSLGALGNLRDALTIILFNVESGQEDQRVQRVMGNMIAAYIRLEDYDQALDQLSRLQELRESRWGTYHPEVLTLLYHMGYCFLAKACRFRISHDVQRTDGRAQEKPVDFNFNLALCAFKERMQRQQEALKQKEDEIEEQAQEQGRDDPDMGDAEQMRLDIARSMEIIGEIHDKIGQPERALTYFRSAAKHREEILADTDPELLSVWNTLAAACLKTQEYEEALAIMERATRASAMLFGDVSATVATMLNHTGLVSFKLGARRQAGWAPPDANSMDMAASTTEASEYFQQALDKLTKARDMQQQIFGEDCAEVAATAHVMGSVYLAQGDQKQARKYFEEALLKRLTTLGRTAIATASSAHALGAVYARLPRRREEAIQLLRKASLIREKRLGEHSLYLAESLHELGCALLRRQTFDDAESGLVNLSKAAQIREKRFGKHTLIYAASMHQVGQAHLQLHLYEEARLYLQAAVEVREKLFGDKSKKSAQVAASHFGLGRAFYHLESYKKAAKHFKVSYTIREHLFGIEHHLSADCLCEIGKVYVQRREYDAAIPFLKRAMDVRINLNELDASMLDEDSDEDDKHVYRGESERQRRIKNKRVMKEREAARDARKSAKKEAQLKASRDKAFMKKMVEKRKRKDAKKKQKEHEERKKHGFMTRVVGNVLSRAKAAKQKMTGEAGDSDDEEEKPKGEDTSDDESEGDEEVDADDQETDAEKSWQLQRSVSSVEAGLIEDSDSELDVEDLGIDVRGWLAGTIGYDMYLIAKVYTDQKNFAQARHYLDRAICLQEEVYGDNSEEYAEVLHAFGALHVQRQRLRKAIPYFMKALAIRERVCGQIHEDTAWTEIALGEALANLDQPDDAIIHLLRGCSVRETLFGLEDPIARDLREKWSSLSAGATFYDPVPEGESIPHFARRSPESFLHGFAEKQHGQLLKAQKLKEQLGSDFNPEDLEALGITGVRMSKVSFTGDEVDAAGAEGAPVQVVEAVDEKESVSSVSASSASAKS